MAQNTMEVITGAYPYLGDLALYLDTQLQCGEFKGCDLAFNGLQVGDSDCRVRSVAAAVDASMESFERAADLAADLLIVHHGIFWGCVQSITGPSYRRLAMLLEKRLALYAAHLPLDAHMQHGNNIHLAECLKLQDICRFGLYKEHFIGCGGEFATPQSIDEICHTLNAPPNALRLEFSRKAKSCSIKKVAIVAGAGSDTLAEAAAAGYDLLLTGEFIHQHYHAAKELSISVLAIGHYQSEIGGVLRLLKMLKEKWPCLTTNFIDLPTGL